MPTVDPTGPPVEHDVQRTDNFVRVFVSYSHKDQSYLADDSLLGFLKGLSAEAGVEFWIDERITAGSYWNDEIRARLERSDIALVLVSQAFLDSPFCTRIEIESFLDSCRRRGLIIFPIVLSPCEWEQHEWLATRQFLPGGTETIEEHYTEPGRQKRLYLRIRKELRRAVDRVRQSRGATPEASGKPAYTGSNRASIIAAILEREPPHVEGKPALACLARDPDQRMQSANDVRLQLQWLVERKPTRWPPLALIAAIVIVAIAAAATWRFWPGRSAPARPRLDVVPLTSLYGYEVEPSLSSDGKRVAFVWKHDNASHIFVKFIGRAELQQLTRGDGAESHPAWSPDGASIAFCRATPKGHDVLAVDALGGPERVLAHSTAPPLGIDYAPDGKSIAMADRAAPGEEPSLFLLSTENGEKRRLTTPNDPAGPFPANFGYDSEPSFSPDGHTVAFIHMSAVGWVYMQRSGDRHATVVAGGSWTAHQVKWSRDGKMLIVAYQPVGPASAGLLALPADYRSSWGDELELDKYRLPFGSGSQSLAVAGDRIVFSAASDDPNVWRFPGPAATEETAPVKLIASTRDDIAWNYSPDGKRIAFSSDRDSKSWELWVADADGGNQRRLTDFGVWGFMAEWSPDGDRIAFRGQQPNTILDVYVIEARGGIARRLTDEKHRSGNGGWSPDGRSLYFLSSDPSGANGQIHRFHFDTNRVTQIGHLPFGCSVPRLWRDRILCGSDDGVWSMNLSGGDLRRVVALYHGSPTLWRDNLLYLTDSGTPGLALEMLDLVTGRTRRLRTFAPGELYDGAKMFIAVSPDGKWILVTRVDHAGADLMEADGWQ